MREVNKNTLTRFPPRAILTRAQAVEIYMFRNELGRDESNQKDQCVGLAKKFHISPKAIRDIWNRRTWTKETEHLWQNTDQPMRRVQPSKKTIPAYRMERTTGFAPASFPSFADVACHGINCFLTNDSIHQSSPSPPDYARCFRCPASPTAPPPPAADLPPPIAPWALGPAACFRNFAGGCVVCGAACGGAAGFDDPFRSDWPHW
jgi:hypothetical protein